MRHSHASVRPKRSRLPLRYLLPSVLLLVVVVMLLLRGYVHSEFLADHRVRPPAATDSVPEEVLSGGPVLDARGDRPVSHRVPDRKIVLTFDDGPDPEWTPKILDKLAEHEAHAVFFVTGTMTARYPELVRQMVEEGHEVGLHTFNHPDLSYQSSSRIQRDSPRANSRWRARRASTPPCSVRRTPPPRTRSTTSRGP